MQCAKPPVLECDRNFRRPSSVHGVPAWFKDQPAGSLRKIYLGRSAELTQRHLAQSAERFIAMATAATTRKEVMPGQRGDVSLEWEVMLRRVKSRHQVGHLGRL